MRFSSTEEGLHRVHLQELNTRFRIPEWLLLLAFCVFFFFWQLSSFGLIGADEPRYAQVAREMSARRDWITPTLSNAAWLEKPPLYYWQTMLAYRVFGVSDWAARLPSAIDAFLLVIAVYAFLRRFRSGFELDGALMLATAAGIVGYARAASMDMALAATFTIALLVWYAWFVSGSQKCLAAAYVFLALATLAKGPVAPFLAVVIIAIFASAQRNLKVARETLWFPGIAAFLMVTLPWYVMVQVRNPQFFRVFVLEHNLARFGTNLYHHLEPFWYYAPVTLLGLVPWAAFVVAALIWASWRFRETASDSLSRFLFIWIAVIVVFFSLSKSKLPGYILPAIPPGIALLVEYLRTRTSQRPRWAIAAFHALLSAALIFSALMIQYILLQHRIPWGSASGPLIVAAIFAVGVFALLVKSGSQAMRLLTLVPVITLAIALRFGAPLLDNTLSARPLTSALAQFDPRHLPVAVFWAPRETEFGLQFYRNQVISRYELGQIPDQEHFVVAPAGFLDNITKAAGRKAIFLGSFNPQKLEFFYVPTR